MRSTTPTLIADRYEVGELLGRGGMAEVYAGVDTRLSRPVAIKLLQEAMAARDDVRVRFEAEARAAASILQPHAVAVYDTGEHEGIPYIVMERLPGDTLADRIATGPVLSEAEARTFGRQVLGALDAAHAVGMTHRDVKPGNILLTGDGAVKIADFGIAKSVEVATDLTGTGQLIGTAAYLSPEQFGGHPASPLSDLYALGVVLYEALAGRKPFAGDNPMVTARAIVEGDHVPLAEVRPDLDPSLVQAVERAMDPDPSVRFPSAAAMGAGLVSPAVPTVVPGADQTSLDAAPDRTQVLDIDPIAATSAAAPTAAAPAPAPSPAPAPAPPEPAAPLAARPRPSLAVRVGLMALAAAAIIFLIIQVVRALPNDDANEVSGDVATSDTTPVSTAPSASAVLATDLRTEAARLTPAADGPAATELAARLRIVADQVERGDLAAPTTATGVIFDVARWRQAGQIGDAATVNAIQLLQRIDGVAAAGSAPAITSAPPAVGGAPEVVVPSDDGKGKEKKENGRGNDDDDD